MHKANKFCSAILKWFKRWVLAGCVGWMALAPSLVRAQDNRVPITFCAQAQQRHGVCSKASTKFEVKLASLQRVFVNWVVPADLNPKQWVRRWSYFPGEKSPTLCLFKSSKTLPFKTTAKGKVYQTTFSASEGTGRAVFYEKFIISGEYTLELFADDVLVGKATFTVINRPGGDVPIKGSLC